MAYKSMDLFFHVKSGSDRTDNIKTSLAASIISRACR